MTPDREKIEAALNSIRTHFENMECNCFAECVCGQDRGLLNVMTLHYALEAQMAGGWQDISTAPKDGTVVILFARKENINLKGHYFHHIEEAYWSNDTWEILGQHNDFDKPTHWAHIPPQDG